MKIRYRNGREQDRDVIFNTLVDSSTEHYIDILLPEGTGEVHRNYTVVSISKLQAPEGWEYVTLRKSHLEYRGASRLIRLKQFLKGE